ncbi:MAG: helix-turn-helix domain-containing protein [Bacilli bacterium]|nr:helix-turn-helix domain-containing protein [Bacilli bacterium]
MSIYDEIKLGLTQAIEYEKGNIKAKKSTLNILPLDRFSANDIKEIRKSTGLTQVLFAKFMGVSVKTVEAWESGRNHPDGSACRLLSITKNYPSFPETSGIISINEL